MAEGKQEVGPTNSGDFEGLSTEIVHWFFQLHARIERGEERHWMRDHCYNVAIRSMVDILTTLMLHVLDTVGQCQPINGISISRAMEVSKGTVSKICRRLIQSNLIAPDNRPDNRKEIVFRLTPWGIEWYDLHCALHQCIDQGVANFFRKYEAEDLRFVATCLKDTVEFPWIAQHPESEP